MDPEASRDDPVDVSAVAPAPEAVTAPPAEMASTATPATRGRDGTLRAKERRGGVGARRLPVTGAADAEVRRLGARSARWLPIGVVTNLPGQGGGSARPRLTVTERSRESATRGATS